MNCLNMLEHVVVEAEYQLQWSAVASKAVNQVLLSLTCDISKGLVSPRENFFQAEFPDSRLKRALVDGGQVQAFAAKGNES